MKHPPARIHAMPSQDNPHVKVNSRTLTGRTLKVPPPPDPNLASDTAEPTPKRKQPIRDALPEYLPREPKVHPPLCSCPDCGGVLRKIGDVTTEILEIVRVLPVSMRSPSFSV
jgi:hypothetical protein